MAVGAARVAVTAGIPDEGVEITDGIGTFVLRGSSGVGRSAGNGERPVPGRKVFIAQGKNRAPLDQLNKRLDQFKVPYAVAVDEPHRGRPISAKVAELMHSTIRPCPGGSSPRVVR